MEDVNGKIMTQPEKVEHILKGGCEFLGIPSSALVRGEIGTRSGLWKKKRYLIPVLYDYTVLSYTEMVDLLGYNDLPALRRGYDAIKNELSNEFYGSEKTRTIYNELLNYLKL